MSYDFREQLNEGKKGEWVMDKYHAPLYHVKKVDMELERVGIDRIYITKATGMQYHVEIKTDFMSQDTGNIVVETVSVDTDNKIGWGYTSQADVIIFYLWYLQEILYFNPALIKSRLDWWQKTFRNVRIKNNDYFTHGILLPLSAARNNAFKIRKPVDPDWMKHNYKEWANRR